MITQKRTKYRQQGEAVFRKTVLHIIACLFLLQGETVHSNNPTDLLRMGEIFLDAGYISEADSLFTQLFNNNYISAQLLYYRGIIYTEQKEITKALISFQEAYEVDTTYIKALLKQGELLTTVDSTVAAISAYQRYLEQSPHSDSIRMKLALLYFHQKEFQKAASEVELLLKDNAQNPSFLLLCAQIYEKQEKFRDAISCYSTMLEQDSNNPALLFERALLYAKVNEENLFKKDLFLLLEKRAGPDVVAELLDDKTALFEQFNYLQ